MPQTKIAGGLESSHDGVGRDVVHSEIAAMPALPRRTILRGTQTGHGRILAGETQKASHSGSRSCRRGIRGWKRKNFTAPSAGKYKRESFRRSRADAGFKNVAFPNRLRRRRTAQRSHRIPPKRIAGGAQSQLGIAPGRQSSSRGDLPSHHPLALPHRSKKPPARFRGETRATRRHLQSARLQPHQESRSRRSADRRTRPRETMTVILRPSFVPVEPGTSYS